GTVVALPVRAGVGGRFVSGRFLLEGLLARAVVGAVGAAGDVGQGLVAVVLDQVPDQRAHAGLVIAANVHRALLRAAGQRDDGDGIGELADGGGGQHAVVEDHAVGLAGDGS